MVVSAGSANVLRKSFIGEIKPKISICERFCRSQILIFGKFSLPQREGTRVGV